VGERKNKGLKKKLRGGFGRGGEAGQKAKNTFNQSNIGKEKVEGVV